MSLSSAVSRANLLFQYSIKSLISAIALVQMKQNLLTYKITMSASSVYGDYGADEYALCIG